MTGYKHLIGRYDGTEHGTLLVCMGALHGNETAGVRAIDLVLKMLEVEPITNLNFVFKGRFLGLLGNTRAFENRSRFIRRDLNRQWTDENVLRIESADFDLLDEEDSEIKELLVLLRAEIEDYRPSRLILLDLHTTSSDGGIFTIPADGDSESTRIATGLNVPVVTGLMSNLTGTTLHYFRTQNMGLPTAAICFEAGQHDDPLSVNRTIAAIINCMRSLGCVAAEDVANRHDTLLQEYSKNLPSVTKLLYRHPVQPDDDFEMKRGFQNFQPLQKGELLATDKHGKILAPSDCLILMPLYQPQGGDGFFLVEKIS